MNVIEKLVRLSVDEELHPDAREVIARVLFGPEPPRKLAMADLAALADAAEDARRGLGSYVAVSLAAGACLLGAESR